MSKIERRWTVAGPAHANGLPFLHMPIADSERGDALVRFLATADDWQVAGRRLGGAFSEDEAARLRHEEKE